MWKFLVTFQPAINKPNFLFWKQRRVEIGVPFTNFATPTLRRLNSSQSRTHSYPTKSPLLCPNQQSSSLKRIRSQTPFRKPFVTKIRATYNESGSRRAIISSSSEEDDSETSHQSSSNHLFQESDSSSAGAKRKSPKSVACFSPTYRQQILGNKANRKKELECSECGERLVPWQDHILFNHVLKNHLQLPVFECSNCKKEFLDFSGGQARRHCGPTAKVGISVANSRTIEPFIEVNCRRNVWNCLENDS
uniref:C2H2-type domain-containing protein n=1 Tax=Ditylenchus dipsaci TaxID=166011 RepID=A0A915D0F9_9BILA